MSNGTRADRGRLHLVSRSPVSAEESQQIELLGVNFFFESLELESSLQKISNFESTKAEPGPSSNS